MKNFIPQSIVDKICDEKNARISELILENKRLEKALNSFNPVCYCQCCKDVERFKDDYSMR